LSTTSRTFALRRLVPLCAVAAAILAGCGGGSGSSSADSGGNTSQPSPGNPAPQGDPPSNANVPPPVDLPMNAMPADIKQQSVNEYPATQITAPNPLFPGSNVAAQDLLTGGLGKTGLAQSTPLYRNPAQPTRAELRRNAIYFSYRDAVNVNSGGGYGRLYGPNVAADGTVTADEGMIPGTEYIATLDDGSARRQVVIAVQVPTSFNLDKPCIVLGPSQGSRGVYGAIGTAAEWGLKRGCAVALTDAGKGVGLHYLRDDTVVKVDGTRVPRTQAGKLSQFTADITDAARTAYEALLGYRFAIKHAHSQQNPEKDGGNDTLAAARYALFVLNDRYGEPGKPVRFHAANTLIIGASTGAGAGAVLRAAEQDKTGMVDGIVAVNPLAEVPATTGFGVQYGGAGATAYGKSIADYATWANIYQPCAQLAPGAALTDFGLRTNPNFFNYMGSVGMNTRAQARCASLAAKGLVSGGTLAEQSADALQKLRAYGWSAEHDQLHNSTYGMGIFPMLAAVYPSAYGRFSVTDHVCSTSFAIEYFGFLAFGDPEGGVGVPTAEQLAQTFGTSSGAPDGTPVTVFYDNGTLGPRVWHWSRSRSTNTEDLGLDTALCQRALVTGQDAVTGAALTASTTPTAAQAAAVKAGMAEVNVSGDLRGKPALVISGRSDAILPPNHNARAYVAHNAAVEGAKSATRYIEVTNAQHADGFNALRGYDVRFVPLRPYFTQALDMLYAHLTAGAALPPSQVVRTTPRGGVPGLSPQLEAANVPPLGAAPTASDSITFNGTTLVVPQ
jgi:hydroxybutyrate-dimer hydrolase